MPRGEVYRDASGQEWRWRRKADNNQVIAASGEAYEHRMHALSFYHEQFPDDPVFELVPDPGVPEADDDGNVHVPIDFNAETE